MRLDSLEDQFLYQKNVRISGPVEICAPADKNREGVNNWEDHLVCYNVHSKQRVYEWVQVKNQFGTQLLNVIGTTRRLCVPSKKRLCNDVYWTDWLDRDNPSGKGDYENISAFLADKPPVQICGGNDPVGIKCSTTDGGWSWSSIGKPLGAPPVGAPDQDVVCDPLIGFKCINADQSDGKCEDYKVRFQSCE